MINEDERQHMEHLERGVKPLISVGCAPLMIGPSCEPEMSGFCATCSDEALPAKVLSVDAATSLALVLLNGATGEVDISLVDAVAPGVVLLIHGGVAIANLGADASTPPAGA
jgi:hydrogenase maturation factor